MTPKACVPAQVAIHILSLVVFASVIAGSSQPTASPTTNQIVSPPASATTQIDVTRIAAAARPAVALVTVQRKEGKTTNFGTGFFVAADGKLVTNAHVLQGATTAEAKLENGATYNIAGILKAAVDKDLVIAKVEAKDVPFLPVDTGSMPEPGKRIVVVGSPFGLEGSVSEGIVSGQRTAKPNDEWLQITAPISPGSSGSPVINQEGKVVGVSTFVIEKGQSVNFARPAQYVSDLLKQIPANAEAEPFWKLAKDPNSVVLHDPEFLEAEKSLSEDNAAGALKTLNKLQTKYQENPLFLLKLGLVYDRLNLLDDAIQTYQRALKIDPSNGIGWTNLALAYVKRNKFDEAKDAASQAVKQAPDFGPAWAVLGYAYQEQGRFGDAADALQKAASLTPNDSEVLRSLSDTYARLNESAKRQEVDRQIDALVVRPERNAGIAPTPLPTAVSAATAPPQATPAADSRPTGIVTADESKGLNLRAAPDTTSKVLAVLRKQDRVFVGPGCIRNNNPPFPMTWQQVSTASGETGWFARDYLDVPQDRNSTSTEQREVWQLFERWMHLSNRGDPAQEALLYSDPADYLNYGNISRQQLADELRQDLKKWPKQFNRVSTGPFVEKLSGSEWRVSFEINFDARDPGKLKRVTGVANLTWVVRKRATGGVEITSSKENVTMRTFHEHTIQ
jgi:tetratricopeptide (TPR) repeat protein